MIGIGVLTTSYPRQADDWAGNFVRTRVRTLVRAGAAVEVVAAGATDVEETDDDGRVSVVRVAAPSLPGGGALFYGAGAPEVLESAGPAALVAAALFAGRLAAVAGARAARWRAIESHWLVPCGIVGAAIARGRSHRAFAHGGDVALLERLPAGDALARALWRSGCALSFASGDLRARFARLCGVAVDRRAAEVEPAPFDDRLFRRRNQEERAQLRRQLGCRGPTVVGVGRLVPVKGWDLLVRAVGRVPAPERPRLVLAGDGPERPGLEALARARGVDLTLLGAQPPLRVAAWMAAAVVVVQPSRVLPGGRGEGTPLAAREALATGTAVIASASGGMAALAAPGLTLVPPGDLAALVTALRAHLRR